jgi:cytidylate kinase
MTGLQHDFVQDSVAHNYQDRHLNRMAVVLSDPVEFPTMQSLEPDNQALFQVESECIVRIADRSSGVFLGRCGRYILRKHPCQLNILVHAGLANWIHRVQKLFCLEAGDAKKLIAQNDRDRDVYMSTFAHKDWLDARWYDLCVNTSSLGMDQCVAAAMLGIQAKMAGPWGITGSHESTTVDMADGHGTADIGSAKNNKGNGNGC